MTDPLTEAVARAIYDELEGPIADQDFMRQKRQWEQAEKLATAALAAARPVIRAEALEEAANVAERNAAEAWNDPNASETRGLMRLQADDIAAAIRALKEK